MLLSSPLPISCPYFRNILIYSTFNGPYASISKPANATMLPRSGMNLPPGNRRKSLVPAPETPFLLKSHLLYAENPLNQVEYDLRLDDAGNERLTKH